MERGGGGGWRERVRERGVEKDGGGGGGRERKREGGKVEE